MDDNKFNMVFDFNFRFETRNMVEKLNRTYDTMSNEYL